MFKHILFPTDTSEMSNAGFKVAVDLARKYDARISLLNVHEEFMSREEMQTLRVSPDNYEQFIRERALKSREHLESLVKQEDAGEQCEVLLREGHARREIAETAVAEGIDLIVMSSNGRSNLKEMMVGSVAEYVVHHAPVPVLVVKTSSGAE